MPRMVSDLRRPVKRTYHVLSQPDISCATTCKTIQAANTTTKNAVQNAQTLAAALANNSPLKTRFPKSPLGAQMQEVAKIIQVRAALGLPRQILFVSSGGFDTHSAQLV